MALETSTAQKAKDYLNTGIMNSMRVCVPAYERMKELFALGYTNVQIVEALSHEFHDIDLNPLSQGSVRTIIELNQREFQIARMELGLKCREEIQRQTAILFRATEDVELEMVSVYVRKLREALNSMADLDLAEIDDDGNFKNTSRMFVLIEMSEKLQSKIAKIVGTDALREIEVFRQKAEAKRKVEDSGGGLLPAQGRTLDSQPITNFI